MMAALFYQIGPTRNSGFHFFLDGLAKKKIAKRYNRTSD